MKQNNKFNRFSKNNLPEKQIICSCESMAKLKTFKNYPFGRKSKATISKYYKCDKCGGKKLLNEKQKGGRR